jgi:hypothetical protein
VIVWPWEHASNSPAVLVVLPAGAFDRRSQFTILEDGSIGMQRNANKC